MSAAGMKDVAGLAGVSIGTVSNVLNRPEIVRDDTRRRVLRAIQQLGFVRNDSARQLRAGLSRTIAYVLLDPSNPFFTDVARGAEDVARQEGLALYLCNSEEDPTRETQYLDVLLEQRVRGVLITPADSDASRLRSLPELGVPVVLLDRAAADPSAWCSVSVDDVEGGDIAVSHLLELGHRRIGFAGGPNSISQVRERRIGALRALERARESAEPLVEIATDALTLAEGRRAGQRFLGLPARRRPTGVFCANDLLAIGFMHQLMQHGIRVPDDVAIVGYDDIDFAAAAAVPLSSVSQPREELGRRGCELLLAEAQDIHRTDGKTHVHQQIQFVPELVVRESSSTASTLHAPNA